MTYTPPPGWYPEAPGWHRYWDGYQWTDARAPMRSQMTWWVWALAVLVPALLFLVYILPTIAIR